MKAWRISKHGDSQNSSDVLKYQDVPTPAPGPLEVLVKVKAVGLNHLDVWVRKGVPGHTFPLPLTPGCDVAGEIAALGEGAEHAFPKLALGAKVLVNPGLSCGHCQACLGGFDPLCAEFGILGETQDGGCADFVCVPVANLIPLPPGLNFNQAAALPIAFVTAWTMVFRKAEVRPGDVVLVQAGGSGVSIAVIQMCKMVGATVITTVSSTEKARQAQALGADFVIDYKKTPFRAEVRKILAGLNRKGCDAVFDHVGQDTFNESLKCLAWGGKIVLCGATSGGDVKIDLKAVFFKNISILGATMGSKADLIRIVDLAAQGKLKTVIASTRPMSELPAALKAIEERGVFGKIILTQEGA
jgi:2-desacetyl-2-hydroxyethyl bacteriochlorophyllide A dehydrogenase